MGIYITLVHVVGFVGAMKVLDCQVQTLMWAFVLWPISGFGITVGVHRLWSHRSYTASFPVRFVLMLCNSIANQGSIFHWARDHRVHHKYSETDADPHNATRGFFFAHMGWLYVKKHPEVVRAGKELDFTDLYEDPVVMFQKKLDPWFALYMCFVFPAQIAQHYWGEEFWNGFFVAGALRYMLVLHFTWLVNSAAHLYGDHPYDVLSYPAENPYVLSSLSERAGTTGITSTLLTMPPLNSVFPVNSTHPSSASIYWQLLDWSGVAREELQPGTWEGPGEIGTEKLEFRCPRLHQDLGK
jgi:stearoyl-CoA desaturase (delta-9 desaturase)